MLNNLGRMITGAAIGGAVVYLLDPEEGKRRRALVRNQVVKAQHKVANNLGATSRDLANRTAGLFGQARYQLRRGTPDDEVLRERVRAKMGRHVSHPSSIWVNAHEGRVTLSGPVLAHEVEGLLKAVSAVPGVKELENDLEVYETPQDIPALQGMPGRRMEQARPDILQRRWAPATRLLTGTLGAGMIYSAARMRNLAGIPIALAGGTILARAATNMEIRRLFGIGAGRAAVTLHKTINVDAPLERVFELWSNYEHFPYFMSHVREVRDTGDGRSHWTVTGPLGVSVEWDAEITRREPPRILAWKTVPGSSIEHAGIIHFDPNVDGSTRVDIQLSYNPLVGALGHVLAALFRADPKKQLDDDLMRMKSFVETGRLPHDAARAEWAPEREEIRQQVEAERVGTRTRRVGSGWRVPAREQEERHEKEELQEDLERSRRARAQRSAAEGQSEETGRQYPEGHTHEPAGEE